MARISTKLALCMAVLFSPLSVQAETDSLQHDNNGNVTQRSITIGATTPTTTYTYDALNRLTGESGPAKTQTIKYDETGNRTQDGAGSYTYENGSNRMLTRRGLSVTLDNAGNITADGTGREYVFNQAGQLAQVKQNGTLIASYYYNYKGLRTRKVTTTNAPQGAQTTLYVYDPAGKLIAEMSSSGTPIRSYIWRDDTPVSQIEYVPSRKVYYFHADHLNTPRSLMDDTGKTVWRWESDAFGSALPDEDPDKDSVKMTSNLRFAGQYYDKETGLHYNWHRYYDPSMGQYIQADPLGLAGGINTYSYVKGNPLSRTDSTGLITDCEMKALRQIINKYGYGPKVTTGNFGADPGMEGHAGFTDNFGKSTIGTNPSAGGSQYSGSVVAKGLSENVINTGLHENFHQGEQRILLGVPVISGLDALAEAIGRLTEMEISLAQTAANMIMSNNPGMIREYEKLVADCMCHK